jgi:hypothetical protein
MKDAIKKLVDIPAAQDRRRLRSVRLRQAGDLKQLVE